MEKVFIPVLLGTNRKERQSEKVSTWLLKQIEKRDDIETKLFDVRDFDLPNDDYGTEIAHLFPDWRDNIIKADGLIIISPEYNHSFPGVLKSVLDLLLKEYIHKSVGLVSVAAQPWGGVRVIEQLVQVVREFGLAVTFTDLNFPKVQDAFDEKGDPKDAESEKRASEFLDELVWMSRTLKWGRENLLSKYHK